MAKLPVADFLTARLKEYDSTFEVRKGTGFYQLFFNPMQFIIQPLIDEAMILSAGQSFLRILQQPDPNAIPEQFVDSLASNFFVTRNPGGLSGGVARVYYSAPVNREWPANGTTFNGEDSEVYTNPGTFFITADTMSLNVEGGYYYYDIPVVSQNLGLAPLAVGGLISISNDPDVITVTNLAAFSGGSAKETNTELIDRTRRSIAVRDLVTGKGFNATMFENFVSFLTEIQPIGFGDVEMMRDIIYNVHVGGKIDGYFKTATITTGYKNFVGLLGDTSRQAYGSTNLQLYLEQASIVPDKNFDTSNDKRPIVQQVKAASAAKYVTTVAIPSAGINLSVNNRIRITIDGKTQEISIAGSLPATTTQSEIINHINAAFGYITASAVGSYMQLLSLVKGKDSYITMENPYSGTSALLTVFGLSSATTFYGDGPITFTETDHYIINPYAGSIARVLGLARTSFTLSPAANATVGATYTIGSSTFTVLSTIVSGTTLLCFGPDIPASSGTLALASGTGDATIAFTGKTLAFTTGNTDKNYTFTIGVSAVTAGAVYSHNSQSYTVMTTISGATTLQCSGTGAPLASGTLTKVSGTGSSPIAFSSVLTLDTAKFSDTTTANAFVGVVENDILTINPSSPTATTDYRILSVTDSSHLVLDAVLAFTSSSVQYEIRRTGIKNGEIIYIQYWFNPLSIDIGPLIKLDEYGTRGIRPGREEWTITDVSFLRITEIDIIDPITYEATGEVLAKRGGYGEGGYGDGPYGIGGSTDYYTVVNSPTERFSAFEDSFIVINPDYVGLSFRVNYEYVPECLEMHDFVRSESERVLDGDILMKHFLPAYVSGTIQYRVDSTDSTIPDNTTLTAELKNYINIQKAGSNLEISEVYQFLVRTTDPYDRYGTYIKPFALTAVIHNTDGSTTVISSDDTLIVPTLSPFPKETDKPLSPRIAHWVADNIVLERL